MQMFVPLTELAAIRPLLVPSIPTCEIQLRARFEEGRGWWAETATGESTVVTRKTGAGMHMVFRHICVLSSLGKAIPPLRIQFKPQGAAAGIFRPEAYPPDFLVNGFELPPGGWVTLEVLPQIGASEEEPVSLLADKTIIGQPTESGHSSVDEFEILIQC